MRMLCRSTVFTGTNHRIVGRCMALQMASASNASLLPRAWDRLMDARRQAVTAAQVETGGLSEGDIASAPKMIAAPVLPRRPLNSPRNDDGAQTYGSSPNLKSWRQAVFDVQCFCPKCRALREGGAGFYPQ
jgi:hypothetical protein